MFAKKRHTVPLQNLTEKIDLSTVTQGVSAVRIVEMRVGELWPERLGERANIGPVFP